MTLPIVMPVCEKDAPKARRLLSWMARLGRQPATLLLLLDNDASTETLSWWVTSGFEGVGVELISAVGAKAACDTTLRLARQRYPDSPFLYMEPDSIPLCDDWVERILEDHGKDLVSTMSGAWIGCTGEWPDPFLNAIALYPVSYTPVPIPTKATGCDRTNSSQYHPGIAFKTNPAITHIYGPEPWNPLPLAEGAPTFPDRQTVEVMMDRFPETALFHRCCDESLIWRLREHYPNGI